MMKARWYQKEAYKKTLDYIENNPGKHPLIVAPTGSGKSFILSAVTKNLLDNGSRVLIISHNEQIIKQDYAALNFVIPEELIGIYSSGLKRKERRLVTVASIQSIYRKPNLFNNYKFILIDEAHTIPHSSEGMYKKLISSISGCTVIGLTATPFRCGTGHLVDSPGAFFDKIVFDVPVDRLIKEGYLAGLKTKATTTRLSIEGIKTVAGDFSKKDLSEKLDKNRVTENICKELANFTEQYKSWLLFAIDITHCEHISEQLVSNGIKASFIHSKMPPKFREKNLLDFKSGKLQALVSVSTLTTGFDHPGIDLIALLRPTKSPVLHIQMIGRGLRIAEDKEHCLILDFAGNIMRLGPINDVHIPIKGKKKAISAPVKICHSCNSHIPLSARTCYFCGFVFPVAPTKLEDISSSLAVVLEKEKIVVGWYSVIGIQYEDYISIKKINSMKVTYTLGAGRKVTEYINPFSNTKRAYNNLQWVKYRNNKASLCRSISELITATENFKQPKALKVDFKGQYPVILETSF